MHSTSSVQRVSRALVWLCIAGTQACSWAQSPTAAPPPAAGHPAPQTACHINTDPPSAAEKALSRRDYKVALALFQASSASSPDTSRAGVIRTLLEEQKLQDAAAQVQTWEAAEPGSGIAMETSAEVLYREGELPAALKTALDARKLDPCNSRALLIISRIEDLLGDHATAARQIKVAHMLTSQDIDIVEAWIYTLPRSERDSMLAGLAQDQQLLRAQDRYRHFLKK